LGVWWLTNATPKRIVIFNALLQTAAKLSNARARLIPRAAIKVYARTAIINALAEILINTYKYEFIAQSDAEAEARVHFASRSLLRQ
jgi:hypothetical protein